MKTLVNFINWKKSGKGGAIPAVIKLLVVRSALTLS